MAFIESPRFPDSISEGASGGPTFRTHVFSTITGLEQRNVTRLRARHTYDFSLGIRDAQDMETVRDFFIAIRARANSFRYKDWNDFELTNELIGTGDGSKTVFQITKTYTTGSYKYVRNIRKPVSGIKVYQGVTLQTEGVDYTIDLTTGLITFAAPVGNGIQVKVTGEFDVPVRFDTDSMEARHAGFGAEDWSGINLIEDLTV